MSDPKSAVKSDHIIVVDDDTRSPSYSNCWLGYHDRPVERYTRQLFVALLIMTVLATCYAV
jgi:hypothetical protein